MKLHHLEGRALNGYTTFGGYWGKGEIKKAHFELKATSGESIPIQSKVMARWPDGSIKWSAHTADSDLMGEEVELLPGKSEVFTAKTLVTEERDLFTVSNGVLCFTVPKVSKHVSRVLTNEIYREGKLKALSSYPVFQLERRTLSPESKEGRLHSSAQVYAFRGEIESVKLEENGCEKAIFCYRGSHVTNFEVRMPFVIRLSIFRDSSDLSFMHTFLFDGVEERDFLKGMGIRFEIPLCGKLYNRHVRYLLPGYSFHEQSILLASFRPKIRPEAEVAQQLGNYVPDAEDASAIAEIEDNVPVWQRYTLVQDSAYHYIIKKQTHPDCYALSAREGKRASGAMSVMDEDGGMMFAIRDLWQKYPAGLEADGLGEEKCACTLWFYSPENDAFDFRHYDKRSYPLTRYEGFKEVGASAYGIGVTSEGSVCLSNQFVSEEALASFNARVQKPSVYVAYPEYYHKLRAFGFWGLDKRESEAEKWLEEQMEKAFAYYQEQVNECDWYGLFNYGDVMHSYDAIRHCWKYDFGGCAWQNTELVDTYWLWLYFLHSGREDVFSMAEAMSRHCSEVDVYHFGPLKGLGSRHNVRHWGCSCKEPRVAMAGHHRFLYYLLGEPRLGDVFTDVKDADASLVNKVHNQEVDQDGRIIPVIRSGPDWSSFVSNWMTEYERTLDVNYRNKILEGIRNLANTPYGLASGPDFEYDIDNARLIYRGEIEDTPNQHLQLCMGGPQIWIEVAEMLEDDRLKQMMSDLAAFYILPSEEKARLTNGEIQKRAFSMPLVATGIMGLNGQRNANVQLSRRAWDILIKEITDKGGTDGYKPVAYGMAAEGKTFTEIPWNSTNETAQWAVNVLLCLEFIREYLE